MAHLKLKTDGVKGGGLFCYDYENTTPTELLNAYSGWGDYQEITEIKFNHLQKIQK